MADFVQVLQIALLVLGGSLLLAQMVFKPAEGTRTRQGMLALAGLVCVVSIASYVRFGQFHDYGAGGKKLFHYHDSWHYAMGAKYYPELGYDRIYDCTVVAFDEMSREGVKVPPIREVRVLAAPMNFYSVAAELPQLREVCHSRFSDARWDSFKQDQQVWLNEYWVPQWWQTICYDLGFNPPPTWNVFAHTFIEWVPLDATSLRLLPLIDLVLILLIGSAAVFRSFGPFALTGYLLVLGTNLAAAFSWTGGSYSRSLWFAALICGLAALKLERWRLAGVILALAACMRVFPAAFIAGAGIALLGMAWRREIDRKHVIEFTAAGLITGLVLVSASLLLFDPSLWADFFRKINDHGDTYFVWHIGFKKWATWGPAVGGQNFWWGEGLKRFEDWNRMLHQTWAINRWIYEPMRLGMVATAGVLAWRMTPTRAAALFGGTVLFCMTIPANYYYIWLAIIPAVYLTEDEQGWAGPTRLFALFAAMLGILTAKWITADGLIQNSWWNAELLAFFLVWIGATAVEQVAASARAREVLRQRYGQITAAVITVVALWVGVHQIQFDKRKNLVVILMDTTRKDRFGTYGHDRPTTPRIDAFAAQSTVFEHAYSHAPWTAPSVASVMTSLVPRDHGLIDWDMSLAPEHLTLAEHLHSEGYQTMAAISHVVFREQLGFNQGFDVYDTRALKLGHPEKAISSKVVADVAIDELRRRNRAQPFFLWTHFFDPHFQYNTHKGMEFGPADKRGQRKIDQWSDAYDSEMAWTDQHVGRLLAYLNREGLTENTVIAILADHGEEFGDHGGERHSVTLFDEVVNVPMILRAPGVEPGRVANTLATSDLGPTVLPLLGVPTPDAFKGTAVPVVNGSFALEENRPVVLETVRYADKRGWVEWPFKLIQDREHHKTTLFDMQRDPIEKRDLAPAMPAVVDRMQKEIDAHYAKDRMQAPAREISDEELEQLRALGYMDDHEE